MGKRALKAKLLTVQGGMCALSGDDLGFRPELVDADRIREGCIGGTYTEENVRIVEPRAHMERHGILRERPTSLEELKSLFDDRVQTMKLSIKIGNQRLAYERRVDHMNPETDAFLIALSDPVQARLTLIDRKIEKALARYEDRLAQVALAVPGLGPITVCALSVYVDLSKAATPSALWKYCGLHVSSNERHVKGKAGGGNQTLRTVLWNTANSMVRMRESGYREVYDRTKARLSESEKVVKTRNTEGKLVECAWKDTKPSHRHGAALRAVVKHLLADYWLVGRTIAGLPTVPLYAESMLGHTHIISPFSRGLNVEESQILRETQEGEASQHPEETHLLAASSTETQFVKAKAQQKPTALKRLATGEQTEQDAETEHNQQGREKP